EAPFAYGGANDGSFIGDAQAYTIFALLRADSVNAGVKAILKEVYRAKQTGFTASELDRAKQTLLAQMEKQWQERDKTKSLNFTEEYVRNFLEKEPSPGIDYEQSLYKLYVPGISLAEVNGLSTKLLDNASPVMTFSGPESSDVTPPSKDDLLAILSGAEHEHFAAYDDKASNQPLLAQAPKAGTVTSEKEIKSVGVTIWQLSNGARVILKPTDFKDDEILFHATAPGGSSIAPDADYLSAQMGDNIVESSGLSSFDAPTITKMLAGKEVEVSPYVSQLQQGLSGHSTKKDLETLFQLTHLYMTEPRYDSTASAVFLSRQKSVLANMGKMPEMTYQDTMSYTLAQYNYRMRPQTPAILDEVNFSKSYDYYKKLFSDASGFTFYFVGNIDPATLKPLVEKYLASLPSTNSHTNWHDLGIYPPKGVIVKKIYKGQDPKSIVSIVFHGKKQFSRENRFQLSAMCQAFEIKLREDIREDKSGVYYVGVRPSFEKKPHDAYRVTINFGCDPKRVDELIGEVMKQLDTLTTKPMEATYIERVKKIGKNELEVNLRDNKYWMSQIQDRDWNDMNFETISQSGKLFDNLTPQDVFETAKEYFDRNNCAQFILYPEKKS
ncbi:MAG TPA: insulinase family protein, partial [Candidatus Kapabacteria bacterium]